jgi:uncharacterized DUF497 family protein
MAFFEWDEEKAEECWRLRRISFKKAAEVFDDPCHITELDGRYEYGEERYRTIGMVDSHHLLLLLVAHTIRGDNEEVIRIISVRKAKKHEEKRYDDHKLQSR